jgi:uncharacterized membrane protein YdbT with pleckstrin-like domain
VPYPTHLLNDHETVALDLHPHWWFLAKAVTALIASIVGGILIRMRLDGDVEKYLTYAAIIAILVNVLWVARRYALWSTTNFVITDDRVIYRTGVLSKRGIEIPLGRVNNVLFSQSLFERVVGAGDLVIESGGETGQQRFTDVRHPARVKNLVYSQLESQELLRSQSSSGLDVASQLEKLEGLLHRGALSPEEFAQEKRRLLER